MKIYKGLLLALLLLLPVSVAYAQQPYLLVCRGGGEMYFQYLPSSEFSPNPHVIITIKKGPQGVGTNWEQRYTLQPGQAAWLDRRIEPNEPEKIILTDVKGFWITWLSGKVFGVNPACLFTLLDGNKFQSFYVIRDNMGNFVVTQIGSSM
ncbi:MAG: hypothetical protein A2Y56_14190 [Candidatus Aminicenantes bacterium RBG_13_63_10]|nr:MAG: hypothetical protein A2Y56_14190 [Candidatus Aminicenantes bacterium RBG_13_63_10]